MSSVILKKTSQKKYTLLDIFLTSNTNITQMLPEQKNGWDLILAYINFIYIYIKIIILKSFFILEYIKIIIYFIFKNLFLMSCINMVQKYKKII